MAVVVVVIEVVMAAVIVVIRLALYVPVLVQMCTACLLKSYMFS